jgi:hypothetical protein
MRLLLHFPSCNHAVSMRSWKCKEYFPIPQQASETQLWYLCIVWRGVELCNYRPCVVTCVPIHYTVTSWKPRTATAHWVYHHNDKKKHWPNNTVVSDHGRVASRTKLVREVHIHWISLTANFDWNISDVTSSCRYGDSGSHFTLTITSAYFSTDDVTVCIAIW